MTDPSDPRGVELAAIIDKRLGVASSFFDQPADLMEVLWQQACDGYLDNPMPALFKERMFVYTSKFSRSSYCLTRHAAFLMGYGNIAGDPDCKPISVADLLALLDTPLPSDAVLSDARSTLKAVAPVSAWPGSGSQAEVEEAIFWLAVDVLTTRDPDGSQASLETLQRCLSREWFIQLVQFLGFIKAAHFWSEINASVVWDSDIHEILKDQPGFAEWIDRHHFGPWDEQDIDEVDVESGDLPASADENLVIENRLLRRALARSRDQSRCLDIALHEELVHRSQIESDLSRRDRHLAEMQKIEAVGRLAAGIAHDFNNDLTVIAGGVRCLLVGDPSQDTRRYADLIGRSSDHATELVAKLLELGQKRIRQPRVVDMSAHVETMRAVLEGLVGEDVELRLSPEDSTPVVCDPFEAEQVIVNLVLNAKDALTDAGIISITTDVIARPRLGIEEKWVRLRVSDNGCGMSDETAAEVYNPFFTTKEPGKNSGLGLSMVFNTVTALGGQMDLVTAVDVGTTFSVLLPLAEIAEAASPDQRTPGEEPAGRAKGALILVCDDNASVLDVTQAILEHAGFVVLAANTPDEAIELAEAHKQELRLLLSDIVMPEMNGPELAERILTFIPRLHVTFMTGYAEKETIQLGSTEATAMLKPIDFDKLLSVLDGVLAGAER